MMFGVRKFVTVIFCVAFTASTCFGWQSGSRGGGGGGGAGSGGGTGGGQSSQAPAQSFQAPTQNFSSPTQNFSSPTQNVPTQQFGSGGFGNQPSTPQQGSGNWMPLGDSLQNSPNATDPNALNQMPSATTPMQNSEMTDSQRYDNFRLSESGEQNSALADSIFTVNDPNSTIVVDHSIWDYFLSTYLTTDSQGINRIHYRNVSSNDQQLLKSYLQQLQQTDTRTLNRNEQLAFWFNLYNARTVSLVLENYPIRSIRQIKENAIDFMGPFDDAAAVSVNGIALSLNEIESGVVRPVFGDPRIHYALNCASYGCPNLAPTAWTSQNIDARLNGAAYDFVNSGRAVKPGLFGPRIAKIYKWYNSDFGENDAEVLDHIRQYACGSTAQLLDGQCKIGGYFYDWSLNDAIIMRQRVLEALRR